jgi:hypothetical protein
MNGNRSQVYVMMKLTAPAPLLTALALVLAIACDDGSTETDGPDVECDDLEPCVDLECPDSGPGQDCADLTEVCGELLCCTVEEACWLVCGTTEDCIVSASSPRNVDCVE